MSRPYTKFKVGDVFYEVHYGVAYKYIVTKDTVEEFCPSLGKKQWAWEAKTDEMSEYNHEFLITESLEHYGPKVVMDPTGYML
jgi:hypothetical protein